MKLKYLKSSIKFILTVPEILQWLILHLLALRLRLEILVIASTYKLIDGTFHERADSPVGLLPTFVYCVTITYPRNQNLKQLSINSLFKCYPNTCRL